MATEPIKISGMTQAQRNAIIAALGCKTIHRMNNGDSLPVDFEPDELIIDTGITTNLTYTVPIVIDIPEKYVPIYAEGEVQTIAKDTTLLIIDKDDVLLFEQMLDHDNLFTVLPSYPYGVFFNSGKFKYSINNSNYRDFSFRLIITFRKLSLTLKLPIP